MAERSKAGTVRLGRARFGPATLVSATQAKRSLASLSKVRLGKAQQRKQSIFVTSHFTQGASNGKGND